MCGIAGWFGHSAGIDERVLLTSLRHRGPDGSGVWRDAGSRAGMAHTRLAIIDLSECGAQPMAYNESDVPEQGAHIVYNGEIYNFRELRADLESTGEDFVGQSDTEVLLRLVAREGTGALPKLAGMFAFAFFDSESGRGLLARDAFGIKPLYYIEKNGGLTFASEVRTLLPFLSETRTDPAGLRNALLWGTVPEPETLVEGIRLLPAGACLEWDGAKGKISRWHEARFVDAHHYSDPVAATRAALLESIERHLVSDVPVGIFLSGGVDSTAVLALAREVLGPDADLRTFSIGFDDPEFDESLVARRTAEHFAARHTEWRMTAEEGKAEIAGYLAAMDQPSIDGFNTWCVSKMAHREGMKVVLSGLGSDELFGGYGSFQQVPRFHRLYHLLGPFRTIAAMALDRAPVGSRWRRLAAFLRGPGTPLAAFHAQRGIFTEPEARELTRALTGTDPGPAEWRLESVPDDVRDAVSYMEISRYMRNQLLRDSDVFSMAHGLEMRVPFVDMRLFHSIASVPAAIRAGKGKRLLLDAVPEIPAWVREQPKRGFRFPFEDWSNEFSELFSSAERRSTVPLVTWYRRWALAVMLLKA